MLCYNVSIALKADMVLFTFDYPPISSEFAWKMLTTAASTLQNLFPKQTDPLSAVTKYVIAAIKTTETIHVCQCAPFACRNYYGVFPVVEPSACTKDTCVESNSICAETKQGAVCICKVGYNKSPSGSCEDINECDNNPCGDNSICKNKPGGYRCRCKKGYEKVGKSCVSK